MTKIKIVAFRKCTTPDCEERARNRILVDDNFSTDYVADLCDTCFGKLDWWLKEVK